MERLCTNVHDDQPKKRTDDGFHRLRSFATRALPMPPPMSIAADDIPRTSRLVPRTSPRSRAQTTCKANPRAPQSAAKIVRTVHDPSSSPTDVVARRFGQRAAQSRTLREGGLSHRHSWQSDG